MIFFGLNFMLAFPIPLVPVQMVSCYLYIYVKFFVCCAILYFVVLCPFTLCLLFSSLNVSCRVLLGCMPVLRIALCSLRST